MYWTILTQLSVSVPYTLYVSDLRLPPSLIVTSTSQWWTLWCTWPLTLRTSNRGLSYWTCPCSCSYSRALRRGGLVRYSHLLTQGTVIKVALYKVPLSTVTGIVFYQPSYEVRSCIKIVTFAVASILRPPSSPPLPNK